MSKKHIHIILKLMWHYIFKSKNIMLKFIERN